MTIENPKTPPAQKPDAVPSTKVRIELDFDMASSQLMMKAKAPTVLISAILRRAESAPVTEIPERAPGAPRRVLIDYDLAGTAQPSVQTDASSIILLGILVMAHSMITQNQVMQRIQAMGARERILRA